MMNLSWGYGLGYAPWTLCLLNRVGGRGTVTKHAATGGAGRAGPATVVRASCGSAVLFAGAQCRRTAATDVACVLRRGRIGRERPCQKPNRRAHGENKKDRGSHAPLREAQQRPGRG